MKPAFLWAVLIVGNVSAAESIPLKDIWAWEMAGTHALTAERDAHDKFVTDDGIIDRGDFAMSSQSSIDGKDATGFRGRW